MRHEEWAKSKGVAGRIEQVLRSALRAAIPRTVEGKDAGGRDGAGRVKKGKRPGRPARGREG